MHFAKPFSNLAVIGAGLAGASCAASLRQAGQQVTLFDKSRGIGGRMATRRVQWTGADGQPRRAEFDHGAQLFSATQPRFKAMLARAAVAGVVAPWPARVHANFPAAQRRADQWVATPAMPSLCRHLIGDVSVQLGQQVNRLQRDTDGWRVLTADGVAHGPFDQVLLALPPAQAAVLLAGHHDDWADHLSEVRMQPCWTLMAATDDVDWPWDAAEPASGPLAWVARNDRKPGRGAMPGTALWVAHATPAWSAAQLEADPETVAALLSRALQALLPSGSQTHWQYRAVHRWRYAALDASLPAAMKAEDCWWDGERGLGVCGDFMAGGGIQAAWRSGDELADTLLAGLEALETAQAELAPAA